MSKIDLEIFVEKWQTTPNLIRLAIRALPPPPSLHNKVNKHFTNVNFSGL